MVEWCSAGATVSEKPAEVTMIYFQRKCFGCDTLADLDDMVDQYVVLIHGFGLTEKRQFCPECAQIEETRWTCGKANDLAMESIILKVRDLYGEGATVKWLQGDDIKAIIQIHRAAGPLAG
jgi:ribosomal protein S27AE